MSVLKRGLLDCLMNVKVVKGYADMEAGMAKVNKLCTGVRSKAEVLQDAINDINYMIVNDELFVGNDCYGALLVMAEAVDKWKVLLDDIAKEHIKAMEVVLRNELDTETAKDMGIDIVEEGE